ncbi:MAG TPA: flagellar motor switch protein FliM [Verrucomicrobiae bacterium]
MEATQTAPEIVVLNARGQRERRPATDVRAHNFRQSGFLAASELRRIRQRHEQFVRSLAARLAIFLRLEFSLQLEKVYIESYQKLIEPLSNPTYITLFKTDPLKGAGLLIIPPRLALTLVDRLLGGPGQMPADNRDLTDIEVALSDQSAMLILSEWCNHWPEMRDLHATILGHENNSKFLQTSAPETSMLILTIAATIAEQRETFQIVFPYRTVEPLMRHLNPELAGAETPSPRTARPRWNPEFDEVKVSLSAEWQGLKMSAREIAELKPGHVLALDHACAAQVLVRLGNVPKFFGRPGTSDAKWAVQLTAAVAP